MLVGCVIGCLFMMLTVGLIISDLENGETKNKPNHDEDYDDF